MVDIPLDVRFTVETPQEIRNDKGRLLARYLPGIDYRVTARNRSSVEDLIKLGKASLGAGPRPQPVGRAAAGEARVKGRLKARARKP